MGIKTGCPEERKGAAQRRTSMKFSEMKYERPDLEKLKETVKTLTQRLKEAADYSAAKEVFLEKEKVAKHIDTCQQLVYIRHTIDTRDAYYDEEQKFWDNAGPELEEYEQQWKAAMLESVFRKDFEKEYGTLMFLNAEIERKTFSPEIIEDLQQENLLVMEYGKLIASAQIPFEGGIYTISQMTPFKTDRDDARRLAAWKAEGQWYKDHQEELDGIYDRMVRLRDAMGRKLGYENYLPLGYCRMMRNCYTKEDVERFREAVRKYLVPVADRLYREQAKRIGKQYPMSFADCVLKFRSGNPRPQGTAQDVLAAGKRFYDELSEETSAFFNMMLENELMDVLSTEGKEAGGYCSSISEYGVPFIFANFNGTQGDVEVVTHEAGHAFAGYMNRDRIPFSYVWPGAEACEVHSMSMEFLSWPWSQYFFGEDTRKFHYSHLFSALAFIPYGTLVDHFQHEVYEHPEMTPRQRHETWKRLLGVYMPWQKLDGEIPFYSEGEGWQRQLHIYGVPLYYIDYCLAQTVALEIWSIMQESREKAWERYMAYTMQGGTRTFTELLENAGLKSPFDEECLREVCETASAWLDGFDLTGIE